MAELVCLTPTDSKQKQCFRKIDYGRGFLSHSEGMKTEPGRPMGRSENESERSQGPNSEGESRWERTQRHIREGDLNLVKNSTCLGGLEAAWF